MEERQGVDENAIKSINAVMTDYNYLEISLFAVPITLVVFTIAKFRFVFSLLF